MDSMQLDPETVDNLDAYSHIPPQLMEKCAALSVRPDTVRNLVQSMQGEQGGEALGWQKSSAAAFRCSLRTEVVQAPTLMLPSVLLSEPGAAHQPLTVWVVLSPWGRVQDGCLVWLPQELFPSCKRPPALSGVFTDVEASLKDIRELLEEDELLEQKLQEALGQAGAGQAGSKAELAEVRRDWAKYMEVHEKASFTNSELHRAMNLHVGNLRLLSGPLDQVRAALPTPALTPGEPPAPPHPVPLGRDVELEPLVSPTTAARRGQGCAAEPEAYPGQGAGDAGPACVPGAAAAGADPEG